MRIGISLLWLDSPRTLYLEGAVQDKDHSRKLGSHAARASDDTGAEDVLDILLLFLLLLLSSSSRR